MSGKMNKLIIGVALAFTLTSKQADGEPAHALTVGDGFVNPVGFYNPMPVFSWKLPDGVKKQTAYRLEINAGEKLWDSGWVESDQSTLVPYRGAPFSSRQQVGWRVRFRDENGKDSGWSELAHFEMGLLSSKDWKAQWIRPQAKTNP